MAIPARGVSAVVPALALALVLSLAPPAAPARAQALDSDSAMALGATLKMLLDPAMRSAAIAGNPQASQIDQQVRALTGSEALTQEFYAVAADVFNDLTRGAGGDAGKMSEALARASNDCAAMCPTPRRWPISSTLRPSMYFHSSTSP